MRDRTDDPLHRDRTVYHRATSSLDSRVMSNLKHTEDLKLHHPKHRISHTTAFVIPTSRGALAGMRNSSMGPLHVPDRATGTCARDRRALQQLALNVHVKHTDLTWPDLTTHQCAPIGFLSMLVPDIGWNSLVPKEREFSFLPFLPSLLCDCPWRIW